MSSLLTSFFLFGPKATVLAAITFFCSMFLFEDVELHGSLFLFPFWFLFCEQLFIEVFRICRPLLVAWW